MVRFQRCENHLFDLSLCLLLFSHDGFQGGLMRVDTVAMPPVSAKARRPRRARNFCIAASNPVLAACAIYQDEIPAPVPQVTVVHLYFGEDR
jgi:hypothetical protein